MIRIDYQERACFTDDQCHHVGWWQYVTSQKDKVKREARRAGIGR